MNAIAITYLVTVSVMTFVLMLAAMNFLGLGLKHKWLRIVLPSLAVIVLVSLCLLT